MLKKLYHSKLIRYFVSAGTATGVDVLSYFLAYNFLFKKEGLPVAGIVITAPTLSLAVSYTLGLLTNFMMTKHLVFFESDLHTRKQLFRYVIVALLVLFLNYVLMTFLIRQANWYPTIARACSAVVVGLISFVVHKFFSFRISAEKKEGMKAEC